MPKVTAAAYNGSTDAVLLYKTENADWKRTTRLVARVSDAAGAARVWFGITPDVSPGGTNAATDGTWVDPGESFSDNMITGDAWYVVVATGGTPTDVYFEVPGSQNVSSITTV